MPPLLITYASQHNPWYNLALETYLVEQVDQGVWAGVLFLWQNEHTVVIGRNQNAWAECNTGLLESQGGKLARRKTGGGAVYHDLGNLNYSFILPRTIFDIEQNFTVIVDAVRSQGIDAERSGRNDVLVNGFKFSGNAFSLFKQAGLHHGTLLLNTDFDLLSRYLTVSDKKLEAKGIQSTRSRVTNLQTINPAISVASLNKSLEQSFLSVFKTNNQAVRYETDRHFYNEERLNALFEQFSDWSWRYGQSMQLKTFIDHRFDWGTIQIGFAVKKGVVEQVEVFSDALDSEYIRLLPDVWTGCRFHSHVLSHALQTTAFPGDDLLTARCQMTADISGLINENNW